MENMDRFIERYKERGWADELTEAMKRAQTTQQVLDIVEKARGRVTASLTPENQDKENVSLLLKYCDTVLSLKTST